MLFAFSELSKQVGQFNRWFCQFTNIIKGPSCLTSKLLCGQLHFQFSIISPLPQRPAPATFKFRVRLTMSFIITRLAVSLLDSTFVPRRVYKFLCLFSLFGSLFSVLLGAHTTRTQTHTHTTYAFGIPMKLLLVCLNVCLPVGFCKARFACVWHTHTCTHMSRIKTIYHLAYQARPNVHYFADAMRRIVF